MSTPFLDALPPRVEIVEVGPRDGLQREPVLSTEAKLILIQGLVDAGLRTIQVTAFVHPRWVPQMADAEEVCRRLPRVEGVVFTGLALNLRGVERAVEAGGIQAVDVSVSANEDHSRRNANRGVDQALAEMAQMVALARSHGLQVRGGIQCAFGYRRPDDVSAERVRELADAILAMGVDQLAVADSAGLADPRTVVHRVGPLVERARPVPVVLHLHDTRGMGLANLLAGLACGVQAFDTAFGGLGGCPFIDGAAGNIATEDTVHMLHRMGIATGVNPVRVAQVSLQARGLLGREELPSKIATLAGMGQALEDLRAPDAPAEPRPGPRA